MDFGEIKIQKLDDLNDEASGKIVNISRGAIHVKVSRYISRGAVRVWFSEDCHSDGHIIFCRSDEDMFCAGILFPPDSTDFKRSELRVPLTNQPAIVTQLQAGPQAKQDAQALDISRSGLGLLMDHPISNHTWVKVELAFAIVFGEVLYSKKEAQSGYRLGLRIETFLMRDGRLGDASELLYRSSCVVT